MSTKKPFSDNDDASKKDFKKPFSHNDGANKKDFKKPFSRNDDANKKDFKKRSFNAGPRDEFFEDNFNDPKYYNEDYEDDGDLLAPSPKMAGAIEALISLDEDIMKLMVRRSTLLSRIRGGREHASNPKAIQAEKAVRQAWEKNAPMFSRDNRLARQFFVLLQDISILTKEAAPKDSFKLFPSQMPLSGNIIGPLSDEAAQVWLSIAAMSGKSLKLNNVSMTSDLSDGVKVLTQLGAKITWESLGPCLGNLILEEGEACDFSDKTIYVGDSIFQVYLTSFLSAASTGTCRLAGGAQSKALDLSPLRHILPSLGARLAHVVPHSKGLPAKLESSGDLPSGLTIPENLPLAGVSALMVAGIIWNHPLALNFENMSAHVATTVLARIEPIGRMAGAEIDARGAMFRYMPAEINIPEEVSLPLDPVLSAYLLAMPAYNGGNISLKGVWPENMPEAQVARSLLSWAGLSFEQGADYVKTEFIADYKEKPLPALSLTPSLSPLYFSLAGLKASRLKRLEKPSLLLFEEEKDSDYGEEMLDRLGIEERGDVYRPFGGKDFKRDMTIPWSSPDGFWGLGFALGSLFHPGLRLGNPSDVTSILPIFWPVFNNLPELGENLLIGRREIIEDTSIAKEETAKDLEDDEKTKKRRIIAE